MEGLIDCIGKGKVPDKGGSGRGNTTEGKFTGMKMECKVNSMGWGDSFMLCKHKDLSSDP